MNKFELPRTKQCAKCPWKVTTDPKEIPDGYSKEQHEGLANTIAIPGTITKPTHVMACHHSIEGDGMYCVGWLHHQLGIGNNIGLRMVMRNCSNIKDLTVYGEQHNRFEDTLPK